MKEAAVEEASVEEDTVENAVRNNAQLAIHDATVHSEQPSPRWQSGDIPTREGSRCEQLCRCSGRP